MLVWNSLHGFKGKMPVHQLYQIVQWLKLYKAKMILWKI
jgi:hypothetical protein